MSKQSYGRYRCLTSATGPSVDQCGDCRIAAQLFQTAVAVLPDARGRDAQLGADLGVWCRRVLDEHGDQPPAVCRQMRKCLAQCRVALGHEQLLLCYPGLLGADVRGFWQLPGTRRLVRGGPDPVAFLLAGGGEPACQRRRITKGAELGGQLPPYGMADRAG